MTVDPKELQSEIDKRRTFAIISHPDAGKTTLTEKLLLYGGAVHVAGAVKSKRAGKSATSDWMAIEKERGISVATSVMQFDHDGHRYNLLDTPGHNDFSEDTYRTLAAADCAVMLVDHAKGVEPQTIKLFEVCRLRKLPIVTFVNKLDRDGKQPLEVLEDIETVLGIPTSPVNWPVGMGKQFQGVYDREDKRLYRFERAEDAGQKSTFVEGSLDDEELKDALGENACQELADEIELLDEAGNPFDEEAFLKGEITPVFFGSAMNSFGIEPFLERFPALCPKPASRRTKDKEIPPESPGFSGFIFKIQANMDPRHRDRIAFLRVVSGKFERGMSVKHTRTGKKLSLDRSVAFMAQSREMVDEAWPGDIVGLWDPGVLRIGDTLVDKGTDQFEGVPVFSPENFVRPRLSDPMKRKQLQKGLEQLSDEGAVQLFSQDDDLMVEPILGAVGWLQVEVVKHRLQAEYGVDADMTRLSFAAARWVKNEDFDPKPIVRHGHIECLYDAEGRPVLLFDTDWTRTLFEQRNPELELLSAVQPARRGKK